MSGNNGRMELDLVIEVPTSIALDVSEGSGNIDVDRVGGDFVVDSGGSGTIRYDVVKGNVRVPERRRRG